MFRKEVFPISFGEEYKNISHVIRALKIIDLLFTIILSNYSNVAALGKLRAKRVSSLIVGRTADIRKFNLEFNNPSLSLTECYRIFFQF